MPIEDDLFAPHIIYFEGWCLLRYRSHLFQQKLVGTVLVVSDRSAVLCLPRRIPIWTLLNKTPVCAPADYVLRVSPCLGVGLMKFLNRLATIRQ